MAAIYSRAMLDNLHDRVGEEEQLRGLSSDRNALNGVWARGMVMSGRENGGRLGVLSSGGPTFDYDLQGLQAGVDLYRRESEGGARDHAGVYAGFGQVRADVTHDTGARAGVDKTSSWSVGAYWTHFWDNGSYLDGVAQYSWNHMHAHSLDVPELQANTGSWALSLEGGRPFHRPNDWVIEPQVQLTWQRFDGTTVEDPAARITFADTSSLIGRLGVRTAKTWGRSQGPDARLTTGWLRLNYRHAFGDLPTTYFSSDEGPVRFTADPGRDWVEAELGLTRQVSRKASFYATGGYNHDLNRGGYAWTGRVGMRLNW
jgi:outer membrane autotransporter protein